MNLNFFAKFTRCFRQVQQVKVPKKNHEDLCWPLIDTYKLIVDNTLPLFSEREVSHTVKSLGPICSSTTSTMFSEPYLKQTHRARERKIKRKKMYVWFLVRKWLLMELQASLYCHAGLSRQGSVVVRLICMSGLRCLGDIPWFSIFFLDLRLWVCVS